MIVWHGDYRHTETATASSVNGALEEVLRTPMGIGYGPKLGSDQFNEACSLLSLKGSHSHGWAGYTLTIQDVKP